jgi:thioredoxin reductase
MTKTAIIGAGPYGLSLAANLSAAGADFRIFGTPMTTWQNHMPKGMLLKSDGFASNISHPDPNSTLKAWCAERGIDYDDLYIPVKLETYQAYSAWFQKKYVPTLEDRQVIALSKTGDGFTLVLDNGETVEAERVVLAVGISWFRNIPDLFAGLPHELVSHSYDHPDMARFAGKKLLIVGAGSSAVDNAVLAADAGVDVSLIARANVIHYHAVPDPDNVSWLRSITHPSSGIGPGWRSFMCAKAPRLFRRLPESMRLRATKRHLGPAPGWFMRGKLTAKTILGQTIAEVRPHHGGVLVTSHGEDGVSQVQADHVMLATGYRPDLRRLPFLDPGLRAQITHVEHTPKLSDNFETSVPGLYAQGVLSANTFGPLMRFMVGAEYAGPRLVAHLVKTDTLLRKIA